MSYVFSFAFSGSKLPNWCILGLAVLCLGTLCEYVEPFMIRVSNILSIHTTYPSHTTLSNFALPNNTDTILLISFANIIFFLDAKKWFFKMVLFHMEDTAKCQISIEKVTALIATWGLFGDPKFETTSQNGYGSNYDPLSMKVPKKKITKCGVFFLNSHRPRTSKKYTSSDSSKTRGGGPGSSPTTVQGPVGGLLVAAGCWYNQAVAPSRSAIFHFSWKNITWRLKTPATKIDLKMGKMGKKWVSAKRKMAISVGKMRINH